MLKVDQTLFFWGFAILVSVFERKTNTSINTYYATGRQVNPGDSEILVCLKKSLKRQGYICIICEFQINKKYVYLSCDSMMIPCVRNNILTYRTDGKLWHIAQRKWPQSSRLSLVEKFGIGRYLIHFNKVNWSNLLTRYKTTLAAGFQSLKCGDCSAC